MYIWYWNWLNEGWEYSPALWTGDKTCGLIVSCWMVPGTIDPLED